jgi:multiple sugar transport system ATP-binding protein
VIATPRLELRALAKRFGETAAVDGIDLSIAPGEFISLLGPSGCGKSTLLSLITGLVEQDAGDVVVDGRVVNDVPPQRRRLGLVFQDYAVFSPLTVRQNLAFGLEAQGIRRLERNRRIAAMAEKLGLEALLARRGATLNMSEMQRVALGRVLVTEPELLLLDEPMSNLDANLRLALRTELKRIQTDLRQTVLYVTHDQSEAMAMSDRIAVMHAGRIIQLGTPDEIYSRPNSRFVAEFIGDPPMNIVSCDVTRSGAGIGVATALHGPFALAGVDAQPGRHLLGIRPHDIVVGSAGEPTAASTTVRYVENLGAEHIAHVQYGEQLVAVATAPHAVREGDTVYISFAPTAVHLIRESDGAILTAPGVVAAS